MREAAGDVFAIVGAGFAIAGAVFAIADNVTVAMAALAFAYTCAVVARFMD